MGNKPGPSVERLSPETTASIRAARRAKGMTGMEVAFRLGISERTWRRIEAGLAPITLMRFQRIEELLGLNSPPQENKVWQAIVSICDAPGDALLRIQAIRSIACAQVSQVSEAAHG